MESAYILAIIGGIVFLAHVFAGVFERTGVPDVILLIAVGLLCGPLLNLVQPEDLGKPKGTAAAALAALPHQSGIAGGTVVQDLAYSVVVVSIMATGVLLFAAGRSQAGRPTGEITVNENRGRSPESDT